MDSRWRHVLEKLESATARLEAAGDANLPLLEDALSRYEAATTGIDKLGEPPPGAVEALRKCLERSRRVNERLRLAAACLRQEFARCSRIQSLMRSLDGGSREQEPRVSCTG